MAKRRSNKHFLFRVMFLIVLAAVLGVSLLFKTQIDYALKLKQVHSAPYNGTSATEVINSSTGGNDLVVHFVDVGQGDACIIELPDNRVILIDGGKDKEKQKLLDYIDTNIKTGDNFGFDIVILTHSDEDHCGGLDDALRLYPTKTFYRPNQAATYNNYSDPGKNLLKGDYSDKSTLAYMRAIAEGHKANNVIVSDANQKIVPEGINEGDANYYEINFYSPTKTVYKNVNDYSPIMILFYEGKKIALSGDAEAEAEAEFVSLVNANKANSNSKYHIFDDYFTVDVVKLGHHGSRTSSSENYLNAITTENSVSGVLAIICCGYGNSYNHPHKEVIQRLSNLGFKSENVLRTDANGTIVLSITEKDGVFELMFGASAVRVEKASISIAGVVDYCWQEIAITIFVIALLIVLIQPLVKSNKKLKKFAKANESKIGLDLDGDGKVGKKSQSSTKKSSASAKKSTKSTAKKSTASKSAKSSSKSAQSAAKKISDFINKSKK